MLNDLLAGLRHSCRALRNHPGFTLTVVITLALAIGANVTVFTLADALILATLPVPHPEQLLQVSTIGPHSIEQLSIPAFQMLQQQAGVFQDILAWNGGGMENLEMNGAVFAGSVDEIAGDYYSTIRIRPALGRFISRQDIGLEHFTPSRVAVIGYNAWRRYFHGSPAALGKTVLINGTPYIIIGVHPKSFPGLIREIEADATVPATAFVATAARLYDPKNSWYTVVGRLRDGVDIARARARIETLWPAIRAATAPPDSPEHEAFLARRVRTEPAARGMSYLRERFSRPLYVLFAIVALLLLLACVNLANVALAHGHARAVELTLRAALGATRWRLLRASLAQSLLLAIAGALPGLAIAFWGSRYIAGFIYQGYVPLALSLTPDARVLTYTTAVAVSCAVLFGVAPAWRAAQREPRAVIQSKGTRVAGGLGRAGRMLVVVQIALSFAIVSGAFLFSRSLHRILSRDPGFNADRLIVAQLMPRSTYKGFDKPAYFRQLLESLRSIPGAASATFSHDHLVGYEYKLNIRPANLIAIYHLVAPGFFDTLGMHILRGRDFERQDDESHPLVAIVSAGLARLMSPSSDVIGRRVTIGDLKGEFEIIGVASDAALGDPRTPGAPAIYAASFQRPDYLGWSEAIVRGSGDPAVLARGLRDYIEKLGREYPLRIETVDRQFDRAHLPERVLALLTRVFGVLAVLLAAVGLYGLLAFTVARRTAEIGVRVALGATRITIARLVWREALILLAAGLSAGFVLSFAGARSVTAFISGLSADDPVTGASAAVVLIVVALLASAVPAIRAACVDPMAALRHE